MDIITYISEEIGGRVRFLADMSEAKKAFQGYDVVHTNPIENLGEMQVFFEEHPGEVIVRMTVDIFPVAVIAFENPQGRVLVIDYRFDNIEEVRRIVLSIIGFGSIIVFLVIFFASILYLDRFVAPIIALKEATKRIGNFDFDYEMEVTTEDELAELILSVNRMARQMEENLERLVEKERLASLGGLVAGVAHEINTPLGAAISAGSCLTGMNASVRKKLYSGRLDKAGFVDYLEISHDCSEIISRNLNRAATLVQSFKQVISGPVIREPDPIPCQNLCGRCDSYTES